MENPAPVPPRHVPRTPRIAFVAMLFLAGLAVGFLMRGYLLPHGTPPMDTPAEAAEALEWTCSMHPQIRQPNRGLCPICAMDLIPISPGADFAEPGVARLSTSAAGKALMRLETRPVERRFVEAEVRMVGKVDYDETRLAHITAWVPGRIERMYADYTGVSVSRGDHMVDLYSPELLAAKQELRRAAQAQGKLAPGAPAVLRDTATATLEGARSRLERWGLTAAQIASAERDGPMSDRVTIHAPIGGTVIERMGREGMYVAQGERIHTIADLSVVWVMLAAFESDLAWLHFGQTVEFTSEAHPGESYAGKIAFIDPAVDNATRTVRVRVNVPNPDERLKPGMFVRGVVRSKVATAGRVLDPDLAGKWISPMHPEIVKDAPGSCDVCGMALVRAEELGYVSAEARHEDMPLVVPATAPLRTGRRAVVYVELPDAEQPTYEGREVRLGPRAGDYFLVLEGLKEGERVVTHGAFKIDSELQIQARPSMMSMPSEASARAEVSPTPTAFLEATGALLDAHLAIQTALAGDDAAEATAATHAAVPVLRGMPTEILPAALLRIWESVHAPTLSGALDALHRAEAIAAQREAFEAWDAALRAALEAFGLPEGKTAYVAHCPMAFDFRGADWIQADQTVLNPYFGAEMLRCGSILGPVAAHGGH